MGSLCTLQLHYSLANQHMQRIDPCGFDARGRTYYVLDDNRLYRMTDAPPPAPSPRKSKSKPKSKSKASSSRRTSKRQKLSNGAASEDEAADEEDAEVLEERVDAVQEDDGLGGAEWECLAVSLEQYQAFLESIKKSKNLDDKDLYQMIVDDTLPQLEKEAEARERREAKRLREMQNMEKLATAKRSSRIAGKHEKQKEIEEAEAAERKKREDLAMAHAEQKKQEKLEQDRESRMMTREQRLKDREVKRILQEEELAKLGRSQSVDSDNNRISERNRQAQLEKKQKDMEALKKEMAASNDDWYFDCSMCGKHGKNFVRRSLVVLWRPKLIEFLQDDGEHSLACERCGVWQHSKCHGIQEQEAERDDFHFVCNSCTNYKSKKLNFSKPSQSPSSAAVNGYPGPGKSSEQSGVLANNGPPKQLFNTTKAASAKPTLQYSQQCPTVQRDPEVQQSQGYVPSPMPHKGPNGYPTAGYGQGPVLGQVQYHGYRPEQQSHHPAGPTQQSLAYPHNSPQQQHPPPNGLNHHPPPAPPLHKPNVGTNSPFNNATFTSPPSKPYPQPSINHSPTPSLSATQGSTAVRFSPSQPKPSSANPNPHLAYQPTSNHPTASAYSPQKQASSPPQHYPPTWQQTTPHVHAHSQHQPVQYQQAPMTNGYHHTMATTPIANTMLPAPSPAGSAISASSPHFPPTPYTATSAASGISPTKHANPSQGAQQPAVQMQMPALSPSSAAYPHPHTHKNAHANVQETPAEILEGAPTLSPSVNVHPAGGKGVDVIPVKKATPEKAPLDWSWDMRMNGL